MEIVRLGNVSPGSRASSRHRCAVCGTAPRSRGRMVAVEDEGHNTRVATRDSGVRMHAGAVPCVPPLPYSQGCRSRRTSAMVTKSRSRSSLTRPAGSRNTSIQTEVSTRTNAGVPQRLVVVVIAKPDLAREFGQIAPATPSHELFQGDTDELPLRADSSE